MSVFNPNTFLSQETTEVLQTKYTPIPSAEYEAFIDDLKADTIKTQDGEKPIMRVTFRLVGAAIDAYRQAMSLSPDAPLTVRQDYWLDLNEQGGFDIGPNKNVKLGQLRDYVGQNKPGMPWSPAMLKGQGPVLVQVGIYIDKRDGETERNEVKRIGRVIR